MIWGSGTGGQIAAGAAGRILVRLANDVEASVVSVASKKRYVRNIAAGIAETRLPTGFKRTGIDRTSTATPCNYILAARVHGRAPRQPPASRARIIPWNLGDIREGRGG